MQKLVSVLLLLIIVFLLQACTYIGSNQTTLNVIAISSNASPESIIVNTDVYSKKISPSYDKKLHTKIFYKLPLAYLRGSNAFLKVTDFSTILTFIDAKSFDFSHKFYISNDSICLSGTVLATNNIYYMDYYGKRTLDNGVMNVKIKKLPITVFFPQYNKTFLINDGNISDLDTYDWSIRLYMDDGGASNNLESSLIQDIDEIRNNYFNPSKSNIVAYADFVGPAHYTYKFLRGVKFDIDSKLTDNSYDWRNLRNFISCKSNSKYKALFLWDHGDSWVYHDKGLFIDDDNIMNLTGLASALSGYHFDVIAFDMCLMGSVETLYQIKDFGDYIVMSESVVPSNGFDYSNLLCGGYTPYEFSKYICNRYDSFYKGSYRLTDVQTSKAASFFDSLNKLSIALTGLASDDLNFDLYLKAKIPMLQKFDLHHGYQVDLLDLLNIMKDYYNLSDNLNVLINEVYGELNSMIISNSKQIGIAFVTENGYFDFDNYYHNSFAENNQWVNFLKVLSERITNDDS